MFDEKFAQNMFVDDGTILIESKFLAKAIDLPHKCFLRIFNKNREELIERFGEVRRKFNKEDTKESYLLTSNQACFLMNCLSYSMDTKNIDKFKEYGIDFTSFSKEKRVTTKKSLYRLKKELADFLDGEINVPTLSGNIDVLTSSELIEFGSVRTWKHALGRVIVFGLDYPHHKKRLYLAGQAQEEMRKNIKDLIAYLDVKVTFSNYQ